MKITKIFLPGRFEDAYIYMGRLIALTENKTLRTYSLDHIVAFLEARSPDFSSIPTLMFLRNDWIKSALFKSLMKNKETASAVLASIERFPQPFAELHTSAFELEEQELDIPARVFLDMLIYNGRLYTSTDIGLFHADIDWNQDTTTILGKPKKRLDARCLNASARYGAITASCGDDGLFTAYDDFGWGNLQKHTDMEKLADKSLRSAWFDYDLVNYPTSTEPVLHKGYHERFPTGNLRIASRYEREPAILTQLSNERIDLNYLFEIVHKRYGVLRESVQYTYNSNNVIFIHTTDGHFYSLGLVHPELGDSPESKEEKVRFTKTYKEANVRILSVNSTGVGLVIETDNRVLLFAQNDWFSIFESEVLSVRTFPRSKRFQNMVAITHEEGIWIIGLFDDSKTMNTKGKVNGISY